MKALSRLQGCDLVGSRQSDLALSCKIRTTLIVAANLKCIRKQTAHTGRYVAAALEDKPTRGCLLFARSELHLRVHFRSDISSRMFPNFERP